MEHVLDNPVYNALVSGNKNLSYGTDTAKYFAKDVAPFVGLKDNDNNNFLDLYNAIPFQSHFAFVTPAQIVIESLWEVVTAMQVLQMVFDKSIGSEIDDKGIIPLSAEHVPKMLTLTELTNPGPFKINTIAFGNYHGIFDGDQLVAMAGHRLHPFNYTEVSAVCTHPDYAGNGYARKLIQNQIRLIQYGSAIPFLHVKSENERAIQVYKNLGFETRKEMFIYIIKKTWKS